MKEIFYRIRQIALCRQSLLFASLLAGIAQSYAQAPIAGSPTNHRDTIARIESNQGAYAADLPEALLGLGLSMQREGQHEEAIAHFRRGVHLARINEGLYCGSQIPLLQAEINSHIAGKNYALADDRQRYLYRVQMRPSNGNRAEAYMQQAQWQHSAYSLALEGDNYTRLMNMWDLYQGAYSELFETQGSTSDQLLPPLNGMLETLYLMSRYQVKEPQNMYNEDVMARYNQQRFTTHRAQNFDRGNQVIEAMQVVEANNGREAQAKAESLVRLGDWRLWHGEEKAALSAYSDAVRELESLDGAQSTGTALLSQPSPLPDMAAITPLPPVVAEPDGDILLEFGVTAGGRVVDVERLDENSSVDRQAGRLMRLLRKTQFRPRFEAGQPVDTQKIVRAFDLP